MKEKFVIVNKLTSLDGRKGVFTYSSTGIRKTGYLIYDEKERNVGIVFMSDDERKKCYGNAEILFREEYEKEFGTWRIIKINGNYLNYENLKDILEKQESYEIEIIKRNGK